MKQTGSTSYVRNGYFLPESCVGFAGATGTEFCAGEAAGCEVGTFCNMESLSIVLPPLRKRVEKIAKTAIMPAKSQVPFSSVSVVCLTPMNWLPIPPTLPDKPPPLGFWIKMMKARITEDKTINTRNKMLIMLI